MVEGSVLDASAASAVDCNGIELTSAAACPDVIGIGIGASGGGGKKTGAEMAANSRFTIGQDKWL